MLLPRRSISSRGAGRCEQGDRTRRLHGPSGRLWTVTNRFELDAVRIEPVGRKAVVPVLGELLGLIQDDRVARKSPPVCLSNDRAALDEEPEVMKTRLVA